MAKLVLWCLNRCARWKSDPLSDALAVKRLFFSAAHDVTLGDRSSLNAASSDEPVHGLQHEGAVADEYFVPIAVKCIGDPAGLVLRLGTRMEPKGQERLGELCMAYPEHFGLRATAPWRSYWEPDGQTRMFTAAAGPTPYCGLYELVQTLRPAGAKAILVGYSQGGLVARFLAWMDENLMPPEHRCIAGVITVQAPNSGSPLADRSNADNVARGIFGALAGVGGLPTGPTRPYRTLDRTLLDLTHGKLEIPPPPNGQTRDFDIDAIYALLGAAVTDAVAANEPAGKIEVLRSARKWLSGLVRHDRRTAFADLDTAELDNDGRILNLLATDGLKQTYEAAVIGTDNGLMQLLMDQVPWYGLLPASVLAGKLGLEARAQAAADSYSRVSMDESLDAAVLSPRVGQLARDYVNGANVLSREDTPVSLRPYAHDFVIPSVSQTIGPRTATGLPAPGLGPFFLGNWVNERGTHLSGGSEGKHSDAKLVCDVLHSIGERL